MGIGGSGKMTDYPSADIRAKISKDIEGGILAIGKVRF